MQFDTFLSKPRRNVHGRQFRKRPQRAYAPTFQGFQNFRRRRENGRRKIAKSVGFRAVIEDGDATESARRANGCINIGCKSYIRFEPTRACGFGFLLGAGFALQLTGAHHVTLTAEQTWQSYGGSSSTKPDSSQFTSVFLGYLYKN